MSRFLCFLRGLEEGKGWLCPKYLTRKWLLSGQKGRKHRSPHELCRKICYCSWPPKFANPFAPYRGQKPQNGKEGFGVRKPISPHPGKGRLESKNPHFPSGALYRNGDFLTRDALFSGVVFLTPKPSFPDFGVFDPCKGQTDSQT